MTGSAVSTAAATNSTVVEVAQIAAVAVLYVFFILGLTTASWAEPVLIMLGMGAAILINNGTNLIFGRSPLSPAPPAASCSWPSRWTTRSF